MGALRSQTFVCLALWFALSALANAAGYDSFADGMSAVEARDYDRAVTLFTDAISAGDLNPRLLPVAYYNRARARWAKGGCAAALADLSEALKRKPDYLDALDMRASAYECAGDDDAAIADLTQVITIASKPGLYWARGHAYWSKGDFAAASGDFSRYLQSKGVDREPAYRYAPLWLAISMLRSGASRDATVKVLEGDDTDPWPAPLLGLFRAQLQPDAIQRAADNKDAQVNRGQHCEANFYIGEWWITQANSAAAIASLEAARDACPHDFIEWRGAKRELGRLVTTSGNR